jgi:MoxR-like ATPase
MNTNEQPPEINTLIQEEGARWSALKQEIGRTVVGQSGVIERVLIGLLCNGHILLEGVPGLAKTTLIKTISQAVGLSFSRIQFTPDLLPADIIGTLIYNPKTQEFQTRKGPVFANLVLADEINRAPAKVQAALLEAMQEHQVTIGDSTYPLEEPFLVLATQNPIEQEGTYHLPEAQVDRFLFKVLISYPSYEEEVMVIDRVFTPQSPNEILQTKHILKAQELVKKIYIDEKLVKYILNIVFATRTPEKFNLDSMSHMIEYGASPRATLAIHHAARARAFMRQRHFVIPDDIKAIAADVLRHRIIRTYEAEAENITPEAIVKSILETIPSP